MSAFMVSHDHIDALLSFAKDKRMKDTLSYHIQPSKHFDWTDIGRVLLAENEKSVCHRYTDCVPGNLPGKVGEEAIGYEFKYFEPMLHMAHAKKCVWVIKGCDCFDYQACETDEYGVSIAHKIIESIRYAAINALPGYEEAPWGIDRERVAAAPPAAKRPPPDLGNIKI